MRCHDSKMLNCFGIPKKFIIDDGGYTRVTFPEVIAHKENATLALLVDDVRQLLATAGGRLYTTH